MGRLLPLRGETDASPGGPKVLDLDDEDTEDALAALSSDTARTILQLLYDEPMTAPEIRDEVETSLQNVHYHLDRLENADLVQPAGTGYSEKGNEMTVYAPASRAVVLFAGEQRHRSRLREFLKRVLGGVAVLAVGTALVKSLLDRVRREETATYAVRSDDGETGAATGGADGGAGGGDTTFDSGETAVETPDATALSGDKAVTPTPEEGTAVSGDAVTAEAVEPTATNTSGEVMVEEAPEAYQNATTEAVTPPGGTTSIQPSPSGTTPTPNETTDAVTVVVESAAPQPLDPAVAFFLGGLFMLVVVGAWWYWRGPE